MKSKRIQRVVGIVMAAPWSLGAVLLSADGCAKDSRISLSEFLELQQRLPAAGFETAAEEAAKAVDIDRHLGPYMVGPSDVLGVTLTGPDQAGLIPALQARVDRKGEVDLPMVGTVKAEGMELEDIEAAIQAAYVPGIFNQAVVHVELVSVHTTNVLVVGAVTTPGLTPLPGNERNMLFAIVGAGGASDLASGHVTLRRIRQPGEQVTLDLRDPVQLQQALGLDPLQQGDIVSVHAAQPNTVFVGGLVNRGSPQTYPPGTQVSVLQALAAAGGLRTDVFPKEGTLVRRMPDGNDAHVKLDLQRIAVGREPNITLVAGDILWVPHTWETRVQDFINRSIFLRAGVSVNYNVSGVEFLNRRNLQTSRIGGNLEDSFDPLGFLTQNAALQGIQGNTANLP